MRTYVRYGLVKEVGHGRTSCTSGHPSRDKVELDSGRVLVDDLGSAEALLSQLQGERLFEEGNELHTAVSTAENLLARWSLEGIHSPPS